ncbi:MAG: NapC/NirT family cytochrome c [Acetobacteraceae bacterium]|nr:NapC/NirT family cytochrome c [Acetobacteraceae bacterium]
MSQTTLPATGPSPDETGWRAWVVRHWRYLAFAFGGAVLGWGVFATWVSAIEYTSRTEFCITCHVMGDTVYPEYKKSSHFANQFGVHAGCPDCHVPQYNWILETQAKIATVGELYAFFFQGMDKVENFEKVRPELAKEVWGKFAASNARECRHCHDYSSMIPEQQKPSARSKHADAAKINENCVECHKGITHKNFEVKAAAPAPTDFDVDE